ncbi:ATP-dependent nuclease [Paenibacillus sp. GXUN7292]|uniref:ATP-dependent nuclease n=1 Tax=Paenibacillus sp. GXUN7292 TaxID=3422499 RepID=UPI003D7DAA9A
MNIQLNVSIPYMWNGESIEKDNISDITYLVGPNGSGKSLFAEQIKNNLHRQNLKIRYLNAERLSGLEKQSYHYFTHGSPLSQGFNLSNKQDIKTYGADYGLAADAWLVLSEKLNIKIRIEAVLSQYFNRSLELREEGGFLKPYLQSMNNGVTYELTKHESHGLKELLSLLTFIYDDEYNCIILDEPELHLHPQYQKFLLSEIKRIAGNPIEDSTKKLFIIITHSPYFLDISNTKDLKKLIIFNPFTRPTWISDLDEEDNYRINKVLPRINSYHNQFYFSPKPVFVEGYTDKIFINKLQEIRGIDIDARGVSVIDVGGKDEVDAFYRLAKSLSIDARAIVDYDVIFDGKVKQTITSNVKVIEFLAKEGLDSDLMRLIGSLLTNLDTIITEIIGLNIKNETLLLIIDKITREHDINKKRKIILLGIMNYLGVFQTHMLSKLKEIHTVVGKMDKIIRAFEVANIFVLRYGVLENYYFNYNGDFFKIDENNKSSLVELENELLSSKTLTEERLEQQYRDLLTSIDKACDSIKIDLNPFISAELSDFIHSVQKEFKLNRIQSTDSLRLSSFINIKKYTNFLSNVEFTPLSDKEVKFICKFQLHASIDPLERSYEFTEQTVPSKFNIS